MEEVEYLIIGSGVSGLSFANFTKSKNYLIIEKDSEPGGYCKTIYQDGFTWDYSGHFFHFQNKDIESFITSKMPKKAVVKVNKKAKIFYNEKYIDFPFQKNIHQLNKEEFFECLYDLYFSKKGATSTFKEMVYANYGNAIANKFLIPYNEKLYACDLDNLDSEAMGRFFPKANFEDILKNFVVPDTQSYNSFFTYPKKGAIQYINALIKGLDKNKLCLNEEIIKIDIESKIATTSKRKIQFKKIISTVPFPKLLDMCGLSFNKGIFTSNKVLAINLGFDRKGNDENHWVYFPDKKIRFYRVGYYDNILNTDKMSVYVEIGMKSDEKVNIKKELEIVLAQMKQCQLIKKHKLLSYHYVVMDPAYVHINTSSQKVFNEKSKLLNNKNIFSIGRYGGWKYCSIEDNIIEAKVLAEGLNKRR